MRRSQRCGIRRKALTPPNSGQSRTEVVAEAVVNTRHAKRAAAALAKAQERLAEVLS
jgi:hypothetical protein